MTWRAGSRRAIAVVVAFATLALTMATPAAAGESRADLRDNFLVFAENYAAWPFERVTYAADFGDPDRDFAVRKAVASFNRMRAGYRLVRVEDPRAANVVFVTSSEEGGCRGAGYAGWDFYPALVFLNGGCDKYAFTLVAAHELGHVFLMTDTTDITDEIREETDDPDRRANLRERVGCSIMNNPRSGKPRFKTVPGRPRLVAPLLCPAGSREYWRSPFQPGDVEGVKYARSLVFGYPYRMCRPDLPAFEDERTEPDSAASPFLQNFTLCRFEYDCRGVAGEAPGNINKALEQDANGKYPWLRNCQEQPYDTAGDDRFARGGARKAATESGAVRRPTLFGFP